jgi:hypothetical protein
VCQLAERSIEELRIKDLAYYAPERFLWIAPFLAKPLCFDAILFD